MGNRLRILTACARYLPLSGGTETHVSEVTSRLAADGHRVTVLTADPTGKLPSSERHGLVEVRRLKAYPKGSDWGFAPGIHAVVAERRWDLIHVQGYHTLFAPATMLAAVRNRIPFVVTFHSGGHSSPLRTSVRRIQHACLAPLVSRADGLIAVSEFEADTFSRNMRIPRDRIAVIPNGARLPIPSVAHRSRSPHEPLIVSPGRLEKYKGHHRVLAAFAHLSRTLPGARLRILGEGPYGPKLRSAAGKLGIAGKVEFGAIPASDRTAMADLLVQSSLVTLLSDYEAHPIAVMEALSLDVPVLTSDTSGFAELERKGLVRSIPLASSAERTAAIMLRMIEEGPRAAVVSLSGWDECASCVRSVYDDALNSPSPSRHATVDAVSG